ncbi:GreA/GreB family transcription elongation factor [Cellulophaga sp. RHA_52]|uniref:GreA/GreB family elongation factor n=1 Tax=Cellulophaga sp. RHA_52 TaxID=1250036 RepID=UPI001199A263|nr:GreA/GreB family elongation factor [Cellulophaga sp. RHA_52]TVZ08346.1 GreA/GreB family transcription elongation factor [Cellulophaga sp. RHA_52]
MVKKEDLLEFCRNFINNRVSRIQSNITGIQDSLASETKSSAGDKHETGRAMLQLEREKLGAQLLEAEKMQQLLSKVNIAKSTTLVGLGSVVYTEKSNYFIAISAGEFVQNKNKFYCISANTPIGKLLLGKSEGDSFVFNGATIKITQVI